MFMLIKLYGPNGSLGPYSTLTWYLAHPEISNYAHDCDVMSFTSKTGNSSNKFNIAMAFVLEFQTWTWVSNMDKRISMFSAALEWEGHTSEAVTVQISKQDALTDKTPPTPIISAKPQSKVVQDSNHQLLDWPGSECLLDYSQTVVDLFRCRSQWFCRA